MIPFSLRVVVEQTQGTLQEQSETELRNVSIDSRTLNRGDLYVAIRGERFDGHDFVDAAVKNGAGAIVVSQPVDCAVPCVVVPDTRVALGQVARWFRRQAQCKLVAVTGSAGKTTTKNLIARALESLVGQEAVLASEGSLNNETGVPLTLCRLTAQHKFAVLEMGMRGVGQIDYLTQWAEPDVGVVTNVGTAHLGVVGSREAIAEAKSEIWGRLPEQGVVVLPDDEPLLSPWVQRRAPTAKVVRFGATDADVRLLSLTGSQAVWESNGKRISSALTLAGEHNALNATCALAVVSALGLDVEKAAGGLAGARAGWLRSEVLEHKGRHLFVDCYNANPDAMQAALKTTRDLAGGNKVLAVLGDMLELGATENQDHTALGRSLPQFGVEHVVAFGPASQATASGASSAGVPNVLATDQPQEAAAQLELWSEPGDWLLFKASRGMKLERVLDAWGLERVE